MIQLLQLLQNDTTTRLPSTIEVNLADINTVIDTSHAMLCVLQSDQDKVGSESILAQIRQHDDPRIYLLPVVLIVSRDVEKRNVSKCFDHIVNEDDFRAHPFKVTDKFNSVLHWIKSLPHAMDGLSDSQIPLKVLRFMASRDMSLTPRVTDEITTGFHYDAISAMFAKADLSFLTVLDFLASERLLHAEFFKRTHFCPACSSAFMNFLEVCPDCGSDHLQKDEMLHHFVCGHVDKLSHFKQDTHLSCPKCNDTLKHIGVDYDKPSTIYTCQACALNFQEPKVVTECFSCHTASAIDDVIITDIQQYNLTAIGKSAALYGLDALFTAILQSDLTLYGNREFKNYCEVEKARVIRYHANTSSVAVLHFTNLELVIEALGKRSQQLFKELSALIKSVVRESDIITALNESVFMILLTATSTDSAQGAMSRLHNAFEQLLQEKMQQYGDITLRTRVFDLMALDAIEQAAEDTIGQGDG